MDFPKATTIGAGAFVNLQNLTSVNFPKAENIGDWAFQNCISLTSVSLPALSAFGAGVFSGCSNLESVSFPANISVYGDRFIGCAKLTSFNLIGTGSLSAIEGGKVLVHNGTELRAYPSASGSITLPTITVIAASTFQGASNLTEVNFPAVTTINANAFFNFPSLVSANFPVAKTIGSRAFYGCTGLVSANFPAAETIGEQAFFDNTGLKTLRIPAVKSIGSQAFAGLGMYPTTITIAGGILSENFPANQLGDFRNYYYGTGAMRAGTYTYTGFGNVWTLSGAAPEAPAGLMALSHTSSSISLSWTAAGAVSYRIDRSTSADSGFATIAASHAETTYTDTGLAGGTTYHYRIYSVNEHGTSTAYASANATTQTGTVVVRDPALIGTWQGIDVTNVGATYMFYADGTTSLSGATQYTWRSEDGGIILSYMGHDTSPAEYSIEGSTLTISSFNAVLLLGKYNKAD